MAEVRYFGRAEGRVQGVGFRFFVQQTALELHVTGWVKNMDDGSVTMEMQGEEEAIDRLEAAIRKGDGYIKVRSLSLEPIALDEKKKKGFSIRY